MSEENKTQRLTKESIDEASERIEKVVAACDIVKLSNMAALEQAITLARGIEALKRVFNTQIITEVFMPLQGSSLGFRTDKDRDGGYNAAVVRNVWIQGCIWGLQPVNNELNIIAENPYAAKNGLERKVREATRGLIIRPGVPVTSHDGMNALLPMRATWIIGDKRYDLIKDVSNVDGAPFDERYSIRVNKGMGADAVIGKGLRKVYRDILNMITNGAVQLVDGDVTDTTAEVLESKPVAPPEQDGKRIHIGSRKTDPKPAPQTDVDREIDRGTNPDNY